MRLNKFIAQASNLSRRKADEAIARGDVTINGQPAEQGQNVSASDVVKLQGQVLSIPVSTMTIMLNKPVGYVVSRNGQGSPTIYDLLPPEYRHLNPVGRLDKNSSGLLLLTNDGNLANELTHPSHQKEKVYEVSLDKPLTQEDKLKIEQGVQLEDGLSSLEVRDLSIETRGSNYSKLKPRDSNLYEIKMREGRNRQIRRTFAALGYAVKILHRTQFGKYTLTGLKKGDLLVI